MMIAFTLSMPNVGSWNGKWSGEDRCYAIIKTLRSKADIARAEKILATGYYHYSWPDGWAAGVTVKEVTPGEAAKLRKRSSGFCGYDWMVKSIIDRGEILADHQVKKLAEAGAS